MKNHDKGRVDRVDRAARVIATELARLLDPDSSSHMSGLVREVLPTFLDLSERKDATLIGLRMVHCAVETLWPTAGERAGLN